MRSILALGLSCISVSAEILTWSPNPDTDLVTNYVVRAFGPTIKSVNVGVSTSFDLNVLGAGAWSVNVLAQNAVATSDPSVTLTWGSIAPVQNLAVKALWSAGAFDITATWTASPGAANYSARLLNLGTSVTVERPVTVTTATWARIPQGAYRLTVVAMSLNGAVSAPVTLDLGTLKPGQPRNPQIMVSEPLPTRMEEFNLHPAFQTLPMRNARRWSRLPPLPGDSTAQPAPVPMGPEYQTIVGESVQVVVTSASQFTREDLRRWFKDAFHLARPAAEDILLGPGFGFDLDGAHIEFTATSRFTQEDLRQWIREALHQLN